MSISDKEWFEKNAEELKKINPQIKKNKKEEDGVNPSDIAIEPKFRRTKKTLLNVIGCCYDDEKINNLFRLNELSDQIEFAKVPPWNQKCKIGKQINDEDLTYFKYYLSKNAKFEPPVNLILEAAIVIAEQNSYHPVRKYLNDLTWDSIPRLDHWLKESSSVEENAYTIAVARKILVAAVARVFEPGCEFHSMMILEGGQGIGKSTLVKTLSGPFYASLSLGNIDKDTVDAMQGRWIIEVDELVGFNRHDIEKMKSFISNPSDRARLSYQRMTKSFPRQSIFIGTYNPTGDNTYFRDESGNRRFWPVKCGTMNLAWLRENRDQLFAEAIFIYKQGEKLFIDTKEAQEIARMAQDDRLSVDPWLEVIAKYLATPNLYQQHISMLEIAIKALKIEEKMVGRVESSRIGLIMKKLGYVSKRIQQHGVRLTVYQIGENDDV